jgi:Arylsulfotransferase (ASST)
VLQATETQLESPEEPPRSKRPGPSRRALIGLLALSLALFAGVAAVLVFAIARDRPSQVLKRLGTAAATRGLDVVPFPDTPDASPRTQIMFPALLPTEIKSVKVTGSRSGRHRGRIEALPGGRGTAFVPDRPFSGGERVSVHARLTSPAAGTASGAPEHTRLRFSFDVGNVTRTPPGPPTPPSIANSSPKTKITKPPPTLSFHSAPGLQAPAVTVSGDSNQVSGDVFLGALNSSQQGPMIVNSKGQLVWFRPLTNKHFGALDLRVQRYRGKPVLTWWQGRIVSGHGLQGQDVILNNHYQTVAVLHGSEGYSTDLHEFRLTAQGTALVTEFVPVKENLSSVGGSKNGVVLDSVIQEIDVKTGRLVWEWHSLGHVPLSASYSGKPVPGQPYDYFHINSIQQLPDGNLLISARNTWAVYEISRTTGKVIWTLGGKQSSFDMGKGTSFEWQHDVRLRHGTLTVFDDGASPQEERQSRALRLAVNTKTMQVTLKNSYTHTPSLLATSEGSMQVLANGDVFVGWGSQPDFSLYTADGRQIWNGSFTVPVQSYRAYLHFWKAQPAAPPAISVSAGKHDAVTAYASWNGATDVARWQLLAGPSPEDLAPVKAATKSGFETALQAKSSGRYFAVRALGASGNVLGTSKVVAVQSRS